LKIVRLFLGIGVVVARRCSRRWDRVGRKVTFRSGVVLLLRRRDAVVPFE
jgi:hypothetical protein